MRIFRSLAIVLGLAFAIGPLALEAFARGGGPGGGGRGGGGRMGGGGRGGGGRMGGRTGGAGMGGGRTGGMGRGPGGGAGAAGNSAKEWEVLSNLEERKKAVKERRLRLLDQDRKAQQEALLAA